MFEEMKRKLEAIAAEEGVDLTDFSDIQVIEPPKRIKLNLKERKKKELPPKGWLYFDIISRLKWLYREHQISDEKWVDFAHSHSIYWIARAHQDQIDPKDDDQLLRILEGGTWRWQDEI